MALRRKERLSDLIKSEVSKIVLFEMQDPRMGFITVTGVDVAGDLKSAKVKVSIMGDERAQAVTMSVLKRARGHIQKELGGRIKSKFIPSVSFELDESVKKSVQLSKTLRESVGR